MDVMMVSAEVVPLSKVGGLADVVGALPRALQAEGVRVSVLTPAYRSIDLQKLAGPPAKVFASKIDLGSQGVHPFTVWRSSLPGSDVPVYLVDNPHFFHRDGIYTDPATGEEYVDGAYRYIFFVRAALAFMDRGGVEVDVIHCHDSHTATLPALLALQEPGDGPAPARRPGTLLTIHNIAYPGLYSAEVLPSLGIPERMFIPFGPFEYYGKVNFLKIGIHYADLINTVSVRYAQEIQESSEYGCGLEGVLRARAADVYGVLNGVDYAEWSPEHDALIPHRFSRTDLAGKRANKRALLEAYAFPQVDLDRPVIGMVGRLVDQKGLDLVMPLLDELAGMGLYLVVLGTGLPRYHEQLLEAQRRHPEFLGVRIGFDNALAHLIEAGSDLFLMPSRFEPCGLNQMYSLRYGTVPIVRATGGLADTVTPFQPDLGRGTGFVFSAYSSQALLEQIDLATYLYPDRRIWTRLMQNGMRQDFSWRRSARRYVELYQKIVARRETRPAALPAPPA
jgi:starch synthase